MTIDIAEQICIAVDEIISARLENVKYDTTIIGTIVDNTDAKLYRYTCSNGSSNFIAYAKDTTYKIGESVQITIPNGDYDQQKIIIGKYVAEENDTPYIYIQPFDTMVDVSSNLINNNTDVIYGALLANDEYDKSDKLFNMEVPLWCNTFDVPQAGFNRLGLQGQFRSWLASSKPIKGDYGYRLEIFSENPSIIGNEKVSIKEWIDLYQKVLWGEDNLNEAGLLDNTPSSWYANVMPKDEFIAEFDKKEQRVSLVRNMLYANAQMTTLSLESKDMYGNPYNFQSYFQQEVVFDIEKVEPMVGMALFFYETSNTFFNEENEPLNYKDTLGNKLPANLFTKDPYICLGYDLEGFDKEEAILYTMNSKGYRFEGQPDTDANKALNRKTIRLRWLHDFGDDEIYVVNDDTDLDYEVRWYRYKLGAPSADEYSGVYWEYVENTNDSVFEFSFIPAYDQTQEQIKAIILYNGNIIRSNILIFTNEKEVANSATAELLEGLSIWCQDSSYGNYYLYGQNNDILKNDDALRIRTLEARFADRATITQGADVDKNASILTEAQTIVWEFPLNNSMIVVQGFNYGFKRDIIEKHPEILDNDEKLWYNIIEKKGWNDIYKMNGYYSNAMIKVDGNTIKIIRYGNEANQIDAYQEYRVEKTYAATKINNTVRCSIDKNGFTYSTSKDFSFGLMGTNGTDATLVIDFNNNITALTANEKEAVKMTARLYDNNHNEVDFYNNDLGLECEWSWAYYHEFSNEEEEEILAEALIKQELNAADLTYNELRKIRAEAVAAAGSVKIEKNGNGEAKNICYLTHEVGLPMDAEGLFMILQAKVKGWGDYDLIAYKAIPVRAIRNYRHIIGPTEVIYNSAGYIDYYKGPYELYYADTVGENDIVPSGTLIVQKEIAWAIYDPYWDSDDNNKYIGVISETNILQPAAMYFDNVEPYGAICHENGEPLWIQPIVVMKNLYPSATLNRWSGKEIEINETEGYILTPAIAAGKKESDNTFSGVMIGDWADKDAEIGGTADEITKMTGVYGFEHGAISYAFKEDGTAFIGKDGRGRIYFDGNDAKIYSATYNTTGVGMMIDLGGDDESPYIDIQAPGSSIMLKAEEGASYMRFVGDEGEIAIDSGSTGYPYIKVKNTSGTSTILLSAEDEGSGIEFIGSGGWITISSDSDDYPLEIGNNFWVEWNGDLHANDAELHNVTASGHIASNLGVIGGWYIDGQVLKGGTTVFYDDGTYYWTESSPSIYLDAPDSAICGGKLKPTNEGNRMKLCGSLEICTINGASVTSTDNFIGAVNSGMPGEYSADGIGMGVAGKSILKITEVNAALNFYDGGSYISLSNDGVNLTAGQGTGDINETGFGAYISIYGGNIKLDRYGFHVYGLGPTQQSGIYARFA